ncbi:MAG: glycosyltransferase family 4 protein [Pirellulaceae bacterium]|jgi:phosphatidylinositol alpha-1,6-mannosyltransferase
MKTLLISEIFPPRTGGSGRWFWEIYRRLDRELFELAVGISAGAERFDTTHDLRIERLQLTLPEWGLLSWKGANDYWRLTRRLRALVRHRQIGQVHCGRCLPEGVLCLALKRWCGIAYVCYVHGEDISTATNSREHTFLVKRVLAKAEYCIANSRNTAQLLRERWRLPEAQIRVLHPGVDSRRLASVRTGGEFVSCCIGLDAFAAQGDS